MAKTETKNLERTYNIPLRKEFLKVANWKRTNKAVIAVKGYLQKHMKSENVRLGKHLNEELWKHGIKNPPHHVKVTTNKDKDGVVRAELFGHEIDTGKKEEKKTSKLQELAKKAGMKVPQTKEKKAEPKKEVQAEEKEAKPVEKKVEPQPEVKAEKPKETKPEPKPSQEATKTKSKN